MTTIREMLDGLSADSQEKTAADKVADQPQAYAGAEEVAGANLAPVGTDAANAAAGQSAYEQKMKKDEAIRAEGGAPITDQVGATPEDNAIQAADRLMQAAGAQLKGESDVKAEETLSTSQISAKVASMPEDELRSLVTAILQHSSQDEPKTASASAGEEPAFSDEDIEKAAEYEAAGAFMAEGFIGRCQELMESN